VTGDELEKLMQDIAGQIERLPDDPEKPLSGAERKHRAVLKARHEALSRMKAAREKGDLNQETRASLDYTLLTEYGERHPLLFNFMKARLGWRSMW
jgi:hypothetical protein